MFSHSITFLTDEQIEAIGVECGLSEKAGALTPYLQDLIHGNNWFNLFVPVQYGGLEMNLPNAVRLQEYLAWLDGSLGWTVTLCSGANWFVGFLDKDVADYFFSDKRVCLAGSGAATGIAMQTPEGFVVSGKWKYATGAPYATAFTANCVIQQDEKILREKDGSEMIKSFIFRREEVTIYPDWNTVGMKATASHSFEVNALFVPAQRCFTLDSAHAKLAGPVFHFPFLQFAEATLSANFCGMATHFIKECRVLFNEKIKKRQYPPAKASEMLGVLDRTVGFMQERRDAFYTTLMNVWENGATEKKWDDGQLKALSFACKSLVKASLNTVDELYPYSGLIAADEASVVNRIWRDIHTAGQHELFTFMHDS